MSKGCFIKGIIILTIAVAVIAYLAQHKYKSFVFTPAKETVKKVIDDNWEKELAFIKPSAEKDSLKLMIKNYLDDVDLADDYSMDNIDEIVKSIEKRIQDSTVDSKDLEYIKKIMSTKK